MIQKINKILKQLSDVTGWIAFILLIFYFLTGYSMTGKLDIVTIDFARTIHLHISIPTIIFILLHVIIEAYFQFRKYFNK